MENVGRDVNVLLNKTFSFCCTNNEGLLNKIPN